MVSGMGKPSRSRQPVVSVHRAGVPWETRVLDISRGKPPPLDGDPGIIAFICLSYDLRCLLLTPGCAPVGALARRGKDDCFELAEGVSGSFGKPSSIGSRSCFSRNAVMATLSSCTTTSLVV